MNQTHRCSAKGCTAFRKYISLYCGPHLQKVQRLGHPDARPISPKRYAAERAAVASLMVSNQTHPALVAACSYVEAWMAQAVADDGSFPGAEQLARLHRAGVEPEAVLVEVAALWSHLQSHDRLLPGDRAIDVALSRAVIGLQPLPRRTAHSGKGSYRLLPRTSALNYLGRHIRITLSVFLVNCHQAVISRHDRAASLIEAMRAPMAIGAVAVLDQQSRDVQRQKFMHLPGAAP
jgi:hypothetical protein